MRRPSLSLLAWILAATTAFAQAPSAPSTASAPLDAATFEELIRILESRGIVTGEEAQRLVQRVHAAPAEGAEPVVPTSPPKAPLASPGLAVNYVPDEGLTFTAPDGRFQTTVGGFIQLRADGTDFDDDVQQRGRTDDQGTFDVQRARLRLSGTAWGGKFEHAFEVDFLDAARFRDAYVAWRPRPVAKFQFGQFRIPFSRQQLVSDRGQQFVERALADDYFIQPRALGFSWVRPPSRELGVAWLGRSSSERHRWWLAMTNGVGPHFTNTDNQYRWTARYELVSKRPPPDAESAEDGIEGFRWAIGAAAFHNVDRIDIDGDHIADDDLDIMAGEVDVAFFGSRWSATAETTWHEADPDPGPGDPVSRDTTARARDWLVQAGVFVVPRKVELAGRWANHSTDGDPATNTSAREELLGINWFILGQRIRLSADAGRVKARGLSFDPEVEDRRLRVQLQLSF